MRPRSEPRFAATRPVRVYCVNPHGGMINKTVHTANISQHGLRLTGIDIFDKVGEIVGISTQNDCSRYRIIWVGTPGTPLHGHVGIQCLDLEKPLFEPLTKVDPAPEPDPMGLYQPENWTPPADCRRKDHRFSVVGGANVRTEGSDSDHWTKLHDISSNGCYVWTTTPLHVHAPVQVTAYVAEYHIDATGIVTAVDPAVGMGIRFTGMNRINRNHLDELVHSLSHTVPPSGFEPLSPPCQ